MPNSIFRHSYFILGTLKAPKLDLEYCVYVCVKVEFELYFITKYLEMILLHTNLPLLSKGILLMGFSMATSSKAPTGWADVYFDILRHSTQLGNISTFLISSFFPPFLCAVDASSIDLDHWSLSGAPQPAGFNLFFTSARQLWDLHYLVANRAWQPVVQLSCNAWWDGCAQPASHSYIPCG